MITSTPFRHEAHVFVFVFVESVCAEMSQVIVRIFSRVLFLLQLVVERSVETIPVTRYIVDGHTLFFELLLHPRILQYRKRGLSL